MDIERLKISLIYLIVITIHLSMLIAVIFGIIYLLL